MSTTERRHMGALSWITRTQKVRPYGPAEQVVLVIKDEAKTEMSSGIPHLRVAEKTNQTFGIPGGGRHITADGEPETIKETLQRELGEELYEFNSALAEGLSVLADQELSRMLYPFLVAQWRFSQKLVDLIPAVAVVQQFDALPAEVRASADARQAADEHTSLMWMPLLYLNELYHTLQRAPQETSMINGLYRPQVLTAAHLYYLEHVAKAPTALIVRECIENNKGVYRFALDYVQASGQWRINNGALRPDGTLNFPQLSEDDIRYLIGEKKQNAQI